MTDLNTDPSAPGNELRARWSCQELLDLYGLETVPAYDEHGHPTGWVAIDPDALSDHVQVTTEEDPEEVEGGE